MKAFIGSLAVLAAMTAVSGAMTTDSTTILALIKSTPQLKTDFTAKPPGTLNPKTHPYVRLGDQYMEGGFPDADYTSIGRLDDGTQVMAVPLFSGGSGGVFTQLIFAQTLNDEKPFYAGFITSAGHLGVNITYHGVVAISPHYEASDANCCPSKFETRTYRIAGKSLKQISDQVTAKP